MANWAQGTFLPKNPSKYVGIGKIRYRSGWELSFFNFLDNNPAVLQWASESIRIPYVNPITGKSSVYVPDIFMTYVDRAGQQHAELVEIKPSKQADISEAKSTRDRAVVAVNYAKWAAAQNWCKRQGLRFRIVTERDMFHQGSKR